jgi:hypothetical protein
VRLLCAAQVRSNIRGQTALLHEWTVLAPTLLTGVSGIPSSILQHTTCKWALLSSILNMTFFSVPPSYFSLKVSYAHSPLWQCAQAACFYLPSMSEPSTELPNLTSSTIPFAGSGLHFDTAETPMEPDSDPPLSPPVSRRSHSPPQGTPSVMNTPSASRGTPSAAGGSQSLNRGTPSVRGTPSGATSAARGTPPVARGTPSVNGTPSARGMGTPTSAGVYRTPGSEVERSPRIVGTPQTAFGTPRQT